MLAVAGFLALGWWQLMRAESGNSLSWVYTFEWPFFAACALYTWWRLLSERSPDAPGDAEGPRTAGVGQGRTATRDDEREAEAERDRAAYNRYLAALAAPSEGDDSRRR